MSIKAIESLVQDVRLEYGRWLYIRKHGCSDPFWPDGVNMNIVRNHIIYDKTEIANLLISDFRLGVDDARDVPIPPEVDEYFMAKPRKCVHLELTGRS